MGYRLCDGFSVNTGWFTAGPHVRGIANSPGEKFNKANGIYFVNRDTEERTQTDESDVVTNNLSELIVVIPELAAGTYRLEITSQYSGGGKPLNEPRTSVFNSVLTVQ
jgi:hypothetical protein